MARRWGDSVAVPVDASSTTAALRRMTEAWERALRPSRWARLLMWFGLRRDDRRRGRIVPPRITPANLNEIWAYSGSDPAEEWAIHREFVLRWDRYKLARKGLAGIFEALTPAMRRLTETLLGLDRMERERRQRLETEYESFHDEGFHGPLDTLE